MSQISAEGTADRSPPLGQAELLEVGVPPPEVEDLEEGRVVVLGLGLEHLSALLHRPRLFVRLIPKEDAHLVTVRLQLLILEG
jgi:hypothetical protein